MLFSTCVQLLLSSFTLHIVHSDNNVFYSVNGGRGVTNSWNKHNDVPTGYPTFIYYEDYHETDASNSQGTSHSESHNVNDQKNSDYEHSSDHQQQSGHHFISSPDVVSKWYTLLQTTPEPTGIPSSLPSGIPSVYFPPTGTPSGSPTEASREPSVAPSTQPSLIPTPMTFEPSESPTIAPSKAFRNQSICINLLLTDMFGDGWDTASMFLYPSDGTAAKMVTLPCGTVSSVTKYCFHPETNKDGDYVVIGVMGYNPEYPWEIHWEALNGFDNKVYFGGFETSMTFAFHINPGSENSISLLASVGTLPQQQPTCKTCVQYADQTSSPSMTPRPRPPPPKKGPASKKSAPMKPAAVSTVGDELTSFSLGGYKDTWYSPDWYGSNFYISDQYGVNLLYSGALCGGKLGCGFNLQDGMYKWRVTGALNTYSMGVYWKFCGVEGTAMNELTFTVKGDYCKAVERLDIGSICYSEDNRLYESEITLSGTLRLGNVVAEKIDNADAFHVLRDSLTAEFTDGRPGTSSSHVAVEIHSVQSSASHLILVKTDTSRKLSESNMHQTEVKFSMLLKADAFGEDGLSEGGRDSLALHCRTYMEKSMSSGLFTARLVHMSRSSGVPALAVVMKAELMDLIVVHSSSDVANKYTYAINSIVIIGAISGILFALLLLVNLSRSYRYGVVYKSLSNILDETEHIKKSPCELEESSQS